MYDPTGDLQRLKVLQDLKTAARKTFADRLGQHPHPDVARQHTKAIIIFMEACQSMAAEILAIEGRSNAMYYILNGAGPPGRSEPYHYPDWHAATALFTKIIMKAVAMVEEAAKAPASAPAPHWYIRAQGALVA